VGELVSVNTRFFVGGFDLRNFKTRRHAIQGKLVLLVESQSTLTKGAMENPAKKGFLAVCREKTGI